MKLTAPKKLEILRTVLKEGASVSVVARENGISRKTLYAWKKKYLAAGPRNKSTCLEKRHLRGLQHPRGSKLRFKREVLRLVILHPEWGSHKLSKILKEKLGNNGVYTLLKGLNLETEAKRREFGQSYRGPLRLLPEARKRMVEKVVLGQEGATRTASEFLVSRKTLWKWTKRYQKSQEADLELINALKDQNPVGSAHPKGTPSWLEQKILDIVAQNPAYSSHKLAVVVSGIGNHGVQNVLLRNGLNTFDRRVEYAQLHTAAPASGIVVQPSAGWLNRLKTVWETFVPQTAPAPPTAVRQRVVSSVRAFTFSLISTSVFSFLLLLWLSMMGSAPGFGLKFGLFFASISLLIGTFFFLYSMKYYLTLALVLSFSSQAGEEETSEEESLADVQNGLVKSSTAKSSGWLGRIFGLNGGNGKNGNGKHGRVPAGGLQPNLDKVGLERYPFISVQLPFYNEKKVANRILSACTSFDYPNYEVLACDDSTDETVDIVKEWEKNPKVKILHRPNREGFKGGALSYALKAMNPKTEFVVIFDADFVPYPDTLNQFVKYFKATGSWNEDKDYKATGIQTMPYDTLRPVMISKEQATLLAKQEEDLRKESDVAVVAGYQWHVLNKSENWITRGVRTEYAGSYVVERPGQEIMGAFKIIHGSVYCMRADVLKHFGWGTSITEDLELTLRIYQKGFKVVYTPYIQAPSECVSTIKRLIRQRMRWAEGHSFNVKKMFFKLMFSPKMTFSEKLEFLYISPYYLQAFFFLVGTFSWLVSETIFGARLPFWTSLWGWSLVLTNFFAMPLVNAVGLFLEESEEKDYLGLFSFVALSYLLVPFQAYAALKGFLEPQEGTWFRTPKTGRITDVFARGRFYRWITGIIPGFRAPALQSRSLTELASPYLALVTANNRFDNFQIRPKRAKWIGKISVVMVLAFSLLLNAVSLGQSLESILNPAPIEMVKDNSQDFAFSGKDTFSQAETPEFHLMTPDLAVKKSSFLARFLSTKVEAAEPDITTTLIDNRGMEVKDINPQITKGNDDYQLSFSKPTSFKPGKYTLKANWKDNDGHVYTTRQDFRWGVLAINTNKSIYTPNETVDFNFAVLDDEGRTLCQVEDLSLEVQMPDESRILSLKNGQIKQSGKCQGNNLTDIADYLAELPVKDPGVYNLKLTAMTQNGTRSIEDQFEVRQSVPFDIERVSFPTRIILNHPYEVGLRVKANEDYQGTIEDSVPASFEIKTPSDTKTSVGKQNDRKVISWDVNWKKGETHELSYTIKFPPISPQFYLVGPLKIGSFSEARTWQIAADVTTVTFIEAGTDSTSDIKMYDGSYNSPSSSTTQKHTGPNSLKFDTTAGGVSTWIQTNTLTKAGTRISMWYYLSLPGANAELWGFANSGDSWVAQLMIDTSGYLYFANGAGTLMGTAGTHAVAANAWHRISVAYTVTDATHNEFRAWVDGTADATVTNGTMQGDANAIHLFFGENGVANWGSSKVTYVDDIYIDADTSLNDPGDIRVTAKEPNAENTTEFNTAVGAARGATDYNNVNERPLSETNGWQEARASNTTTSAFTTNGSWLTPPGVVSANVELYGGGGGGGKVSNATSVRGGGGGGEYAKEAALTVTPGTTYNIGIGGTGSNGGGNGGDTTFNTTGVVAHGGTGGGTSGATGGAGGTGSTNTVHYNGGKGVDGSGSNGGGGGGSGGTGSVGNTGVGSTGAIAVAGGYNGGNGRSGTTGAGSSPTDAYAGGGGGAYTSSRATANGGAGKPGYAKVTYRYSPLSALTDNFDDSSRDAAKWETNVSVWSSAEQNGEVELTSTTGAGSASFNSVNSQKYDLTGSYMYAKLVDSGNLNLASYRVYFWAGIDSSNWVGFKLNSGGDKTIRAMHTITGTETTVGSAVAYNSSVHTWLRVRESGGTTYYDTSADGLSWTNLASEANPITLTAVKPVMNTSGGVEASTTVTKFDNFNTGGTSGRVENYGIENSATGDVDISANTYVGYASWVWAKAGSGTIGTTNMFNNGTETAITLTTTSTMFKNVVTSTSYPSDAAAVGMRANGGSADTYFYEGGMLVAFSGAPVPEFALFLAPLSAFLPKIMHSLQKGTLVKDFKDLVKTFVNKLGKLIEKFIFLRRRKQVLGKNKRKRNKSPG